MVEHKIKEIDFMMGFTGVVLILVAGAVVFPFVSKKIKGKKNKNEKPTAKRGSKTCNSH